MKTKLWKVKTSVGAFFEERDKVVNASNIKEALRKATSRKGNFRLQNIIQVSFIAEESQ